MSQNEFTTAKNIAISQLVNKSYKCIRILTYQSYLLLLNPPKISGY